MIEAQKADFGLFGFGRQIEESGKYFAFKTKCRWSWVFWAIRQADMRMRLWFTACKFLTPKPPSFFGAQMSFQAFHVDKKGNQDFSIAPACIFRVSSDQIKEGRRVEDIFYHTLWSILLHDNAFWVEERWSYISEMYPEKKYRGFVVGENERMCKLWRVSVHRDVQILY